MAKEAPPFGVHVNVIAVVVECYCDDRCFLFRQRRLLVFAVCAAYRRAQSDQGDRPERPAVVTKRLWSIIVS